MQIAIVNATPHPITFSAPADAENEVFTLAVDTVIDAHIVETPAGGIRCPHHLRTGELEPVEGCQNCVRFVRTSYETEPGEEAKLRFLEQRGRCAHCGAWEPPQHDGCPCCGGYFEPCEQAVVIVGSVIAAQAFPGRVLGMVPVPGFERVAPEQKRMRHDVFVTF